MKNKFYLVSFEYNSIYEMRGFFLNKKNAIKRLQKLKKLLSSNLEDPGTIRIIFGGYKIEECEFDDWEEE